MLFHVLFDGQNYIKNADFREQKRDEIQTKFNRAYAWSCAVFSVSIDSNSSLLERKNPSTQSSMS